MFNMLCVSDTEFQRRKKVKKNNPETEADYSCFVAHVTDSSLQTDALVRLC